MDLFITYNVNKVTQYFSKLTYLDRISCLYEKLRKKYQKSYRNIENYICIT